MYETIKKNKFFFIFFFFFFSLILEFFLNLDLLGGTKNDFYKTFIIVQEIKNNFNLFNEDAFHFPTHYLFLALINLILENETYTRLLYVFFSLSIPIIFYKCLIIKYKTINKLNLFLLSCSIFLLPAFRSCAIWANLHITAIFFYTCSLYFFLICEKNNFKKNKNFFFLITFLFLAIYTRIDFLFIYCAVFLIIFFKIDNKRKFFLIFYSFMLTIPLVIIILNYKYLLLGKAPNDQYAFFSTSYFNSIVINSSYFFFYIFPIFLRNILKFISIKFFLKKKIIAFIASILISLVVFPNFNYVASYGGGIFFKISNLILENNKIIFFFSFIGLYITLYLSLFSLRNFIFLFLFFLTYNSFYLMQKYVEPSLLILFFILLKYKNGFKLFDKKALYFTYIFFFFYWLGTLIYRYYLSF